MMKVNKLINRIYVVFRRIVSKSILYIYPSEQDGWKKDATFFLNSKDTYFDPYSFEGEKKYIFVSNRNKCSIERFDVKKDMTLYNCITVLMPGAKGCWDEIVNRACVVKCDEIWHMWFTGQHGGQSCIGYASSIDGVHYKKNENPVMVPQEPYEGESIMNPSVLWDSSDQCFKMWYAAGEQYEPDIICYATSKDGIEWFKSNSNPVLTKGIDCYDKAKVGGPDVRKCGESYIMFYIGYQNIDNARICIANSDDGISWTRDEANPILSPTKGGWDSDAVYKPCVIESEDKLYLYYNGRKKDYETIGLAYKEKRE